MPVIPPCSMSCDVPRLFKTSDVTAVCFHCRQAYLKWRFAMTHPPREGEE